jgi:hypothetical protein
MLLYSRSIEISVLNCHEPVSMIRWASIFQGHDKALRLMQGFFRANGGCGYVKKPDFLLTTGPNGEVFDPKGSLPVKKTLKVGVCFPDFDN